MEELNLADMLFQQDDETRRTARKTMVQLRGDSNEQFISSLGDLTPLN